MDRHDPADRRQGTEPSDTERLVGETAASDPLTDAERVQPPEAETREALSAQPPQEERSGARSRARREGGEG